MGKFYMYSSAFIAQISGLLMATSQTWSSPMLLKLNDSHANPLQREITSGENSWLASLPVLGGIFGALAVGFISSTFGRKTFLISGGVPFLICNLVMAWATNIWYLYISRFLSGISLGIIFPVLSMYTGEIADAGNRGILGSSMSVFITAGMLIPYSIGPFIPWVWTHIILAILPAIYIPLFYFCAPETPYFLVSRGDPSARNVLKKLRGAANVDKAMEEIQNAVKNKQEKMPISEIFSDRGLRRGFFTGFGLGTFTQFSGMGIIFAYAQTIFEDAGQDISPEICPILLAVAQFVTGMITSSISEKFPRKFLLLLSYIGVAVSLSPLGAYYFAKDNGWDVEPYNFVPLVCLMAFIIIFNFGVGPVSMTLLTELYPMRAKGTILSIIVLYNWAMAFGLTFLFNILKDWQGLGIVFWFFAVTCSLGAFFVKFYVIETKGKTLEEIQQRLRQ